MHREVVFCFVLSGIVSLVSVSEGFSFSEELSFGFRSQRICFLGFGLRRFVSLVSVSLHSGKWERLREIAVILHFRPFEKASLS